MTACCWECGKCAKYVGLVFWQNWAHPLVSGRPARDVNFARLLPRATSSVVARTSSSPHLHLLLQPACQPPAEQPPSCRLFSSSSLVWVSGRELQISASIHRSMKITTPRIMTSLTTLLMMAGVKQLMH